MAVKMLRRITQETFDECVQGNIDDFEMEPDEAVEEAVKEFELQGVDISQIDKSYAGPDGRGEHPAASAAKEHAAAVETNAANVEDTAKKLRECISGEGAVPGWGSACVNAGAVQACWRRCEQTVTGPDVSTDVVTDAMTTLAAVLGCDEARDTFVGLRHPMKFVTEHWPACVQSHPTSVASMCQVVAAAATKNEAAKGAFIKAGVEVPLVAVFQTPESTGEVLRAACAAVKALTTGDDPREPASGAFTHSRAFAKAGAASALCASLKRVDAKEDAHLCASLASALKHTAVNDDICKETAEHGGVARALELLSTDAIAAGDARLAKACAACLRQLAGSDSNKSLIVNAGGLAVLVHVVNVFGARASDSNCADVDVAKYRSVQEQCVGCLAALLLKNPEGAARCGAEGVFEPVVDAMSKARTHAGVQRQCAMFLRNAVVRNPENVPAVLLNTDAEALLRLSKKNHPRECVDVASAAMRDLGCENYNEGWTPTTAVMGADGVVRTPEELGDEPEGCVNGPIPE